MDRRETSHKWYTDFSEKTMEFILEDGEGGEERIPAEYEVCGTCNGKGSHVNPSIDSHGLSREDFDQDPDFEEMYFSGAYDQPCNECKGKRVAPTVRWEVLTPEVKKRVEERIDDHYSYQQECDMERRMGC